MKNWLPALPLLAMLLAVSGVQADKLYKWTDAEGNLHYTDHPPTPAEAKKQEHKRFGDKPADSGLPYALQQAVKNFPVTLFTSDCGDACTQAAALLTKRGVPFVEKNAREAAVQDELKALNSGKLEVPVIMLGTQLIRGFEENAWTQALDAAGYPSSPVVPAAVAAKAVKKVKAQAPRPAAKKEKEAAQNEKEAQKEQSEPAKPAVAEDKPVNTPKAAAQ
jgi:glutaredoxin